MLEVKNVVKTFDGFRALDGLTMTVPKGAVYGLVGPNGAGKSTIIRHLAGIYRQDSGEVLLDGQLVYENTGVKRRMAVIGDDWYYFPQAGIREMAKFFAGIYPDFSWERYEKLKQVFPLDEKMMLRRMSKGMQKQAAFWLTVCCMPEYLILDEPVDGLDPVMRRQVWSLLLGDVAERGTTVLVSSHNLRELEDVCDHVGILDHGKVLLERSLEQLQDNMVKLQVVFPEGMDAVPAELPVLHAAKLGRIHTLILRMNAQKAEELAKRLKGRTAENAALAAECDVLFFAVKPNALASMIEGIRDILKNRSDYLIISMAAGVSIAKINGYLSFDAPVIRIMPNTPASVGEGMILWCADALVSDAAKERFLRIMSRAGELDELSESLIDAGCAVSGCGPAFVYMMIGALADGAVECGIPRDKALKYATQTLLGAATLVKATGLHPEALKDAVCSPGGSTIAGVHALEDGAFRASIMNAVCASFRKTEELGK